MSAETFAMADAIRQCSAWARGPIATSISAASISHAVLQSPFISCCFCCHVGRAGAGAAARTQSAAGTEAEKHAASGWCRRCHCWRRRRRHCGGASPDRSRPPSRDCGGRARDRRALRHRQQHFRRALRSRRALDAHAGHQSGGEARARAAGLDIYPAPPGPEAAHRPAQRARRRDGGLSRRASCAPTARSQDARAARPTSRARRRCRRTSATGARRSSSCSARSAAARISIEISALDFARSPSATSMLSAARVSARCWRSSRRGPAGAAQCAGDARSQSARNGGRSGDRRAAASRRAPRSSRFRPACSRPTRSSSRPTCRSASSMPSRSSRSAATTTWRWSCRAIRCTCATTIWCSRKRPAPRTAALLANVSGTPLCMVDVGGKFGRDLAGARARRRWWTSRLDWLAEPLRRRREEGDRQRRMRRAGTRSRGRSARSRPRRRAGRARRKS